MAQKSPIVKENFPLFGVVYIRGVMRLSLSEPIMTDITDEYLCHWAAIWQWAHSLFYSEYIKCSQLPSWGTLHGVNIRPTTAHLDLSNAMVSCTTGVRCVVKLIDTDMLLQSYDNWRIDIVRVQAHGCCLGHCTSHHFNTEVQLRTGVFWPSSMETWMQHENHQNSFWHRSLPIN